MVRSGLNGHPGESQVPSTLQLSPRARAPCCDPINGLGVVPVRVACLEEAVSMATRSSTSVSLVDRARSREEPLSSSHLLKLSSNLFGSVCNRARQHGSALREPSVGASKPHLAGFARQAPLLGSQAWPAWHQSPHTGSAEGA